MDYSIFPKSHIYYRVYRPIFLLIVGLARLSDAASANRISTDIQIPISTTTAQVAEKPDRQFGGLSCAGKNGFYPDPAHLCAVYYLCSPDGSRVMFECPLGKSFDIISQLCIEASLATCFDIGTSEAPRTKTPKQLSVKINASLNEIPSIRPTRETTTEYFTQLSLEPQISNTLSSDILSESVRTKTPGLFNCAGKRGYFPDVSTRCNTYYYCDASAKALKFQCPLDLAFDKKEQACVYPQKTNCGLVLDPLSKRHRQLFSQEQSSSVGVQQQLPHGQNDNPVWKEKTAADGTSPRVLAIARNGSLQQDMLEQQLIRFRGTNSDGTLLQPGVLQKQMGMLNFNNGERQLTQSFQLPSGSGNQIMQPTANQQQNQPFATQPGSAATGYGAVTSSANQGAQNQNTAAFTGQDLNVFPVNQQQYQNSGGSANNPNIGVGQFGNLQSGTGFSQQVLQNVQSQLSSGYLGKFPSNSNFPSSGGQSGTQNAQFGNQQSEGNIGNLNPQQQQILSAANVIPYGSTVVNGFITQSGANPSQNQVAASSGQFNNQQSLQPPVSQSQSPNTPLQAGSSFNNQNVGVGQLANQQFGTGSSQQVSQINAQTGVFGFSAINQGPAGNQQQTGFSGGNQQQSFQATGGQSSSMPQTQQQGQTAPQSNQQQPFGQLGNQIPTQQQSVAFANQQQPLTGNQQAIGLNSHQPSTGFGQQSLGNQQNQQNIGSNLQQQSNILGEQSSGNQQNIGSNLQQQPTAFGQQTFGNQPIQQQFLGNQQPNYATAGFMQPNVSPVGPNRDLQNILRVPPPQLGKDEAVMTDTQNTEKQLSPVEGAVKSLLLDNSTRRQLVADVPQIDPSCNGLARGFYALPGCHDYFYCSTFGERLNYSCQNGMLWNSTTGLCDDEAKVNCRSSGRNDIMKMDQPELFSCEGRVGNFADYASGCKLFHRCRPNGQMETHQCANKMLFSVKDDVCMQAEEVVCADNSTMISSIKKSVTKAADTGFSCHNLSPGRYANLDDACRSFWICDELGQDKLQRCPEGSIFDNLVQACDNPTNVNCANQSVQETTTTIALNKIFSCGGNIGFFAEVSNKCKTYYYCTKDSKAHKFTCPLNYVYSEAKEACDAPERTLCLTNMTSPSSTPSSTTVSSSEMQAQASVQKLNWVLPDPQQRSSVINPWTKFTDFNAPDQANAQTNSRWISFPPNSGPFERTGSRSIRHSFPNFFPPNDNVQSGWQQRQFFDSPSPTVAEFQHFFDRQTHPFNFSLQPNFDRGSRIKPLKDDFKNADVNHGRQSSTNAFSANPFPRALSVSFLEQQFQNQLNNPQFTQSFFPTTGQHLTQPIIATHDQLIHTAGFPQSVFGFGNQPDPPVAPRSAISKFQNLQISEPLPILFPTVLPFLDFPTFSPRSLNHQSLCPPGRTGFVSNTVADCRSYAFCEMSGLVSEFTCPPNTAFNESLIACDLSTFNQCLSAAISDTQSALGTNDCFGKQSGYYTSFSSTCREFYFCAPPTKTGFSEKIDYKCPDNFFFDEYRGVCVEHGACVSAEASRAMQEIASSTIGPSILDTVVSRQFEQLQADSPSQRSLTPHISDKQRENINFPCKEPGQSADFDSGCSGFWSCKAAGEFATFIRCQPGKLFDQIQGRCLASSVVSCLPAADSSKKNGAFSCAGKPTGFFADLTEKCRKFHHCISETEMFTYTCPFDWIFHEKLGECVEPENHTCPSLLTSKFSAFNCFGRSGFYADYSQNCQVFHFCRLHGSRVTMSCPPTMIFDENEGKCLYKTICVPPLPPTQTQREMTFGPKSLTTFTFECPLGATGYFGDPQYSCRLYWQCVDGVRVQNRSCPGYLRFNATSELCEHPDDVICVDPLALEALFPGLLRGMFVSDFLPGITDLTVNRPTLPTVNKALSSAPLQSDQKNLCDNDQLGYYSDLTSNCRTFYHCSPDGSKKMYTCPGFMIFNESMMQCQDQPLSSCSSSRSPFFPTINQVPVLVSHRDLFQEPSFFNSPMSGLQFPFNLHDPSTAEDPFIGLTRNGFRFPVGDHSSLLQLGSSQDSSNQLPNLNSQSSSSESRLHPGVFSPNFRRQSDALPQSFFPHNGGTKSRHLVAHSASRPMIFDSNGLFNHGRLRPWHFSFSTIAPTSTTTNGSTTLSTAMPGMEEGEYEPEEGMLTQAATTVGPTTTLPPSKSMPLMLDPLLSDSTKPTKTIAVDPTKPLGIDCAGKKGYFLQPGTGCKGYVYCKTSGVAYGFTCPGEYMYNAEKEICDWPENVMCLTASSHSVPKPPLRRWQRSPAPESQSQPRIPYSCSLGQQGYFADNSSDCHRFFSCSENGTAVEYECPHPSLKFDQARGVCDWGTKVRCGNDSLIGQIPSSPSEAIEETTQLNSSKDCPATGFYADYESGCRNFYFCGPEGLRLNYSCPEGQRYDAKKERCDNSSAVLCNNTRISKAYGKKVRLVTRTRLVSVNGETSVDCRQRRGLFADPKSNCSNFFYCSPQGLKFEYSCPSNMAFNNAVNACDDLSNSSCAAIP